MKKILLAVLILTVMASSAQASHTQTAKEHDITVHVFGLVCDFCARAIEKVFLKREEVEAIDVDLDNFEVTIDLKDGTTIDDEIVTKLITDSGYTVNEIVRENNG